MRNDKYQPSPGAHLTRTSRAALMRLYEARGAEPGHELEDWLEAENEIQQARSGHPREVMKDCG